jgi:hypothetical protein
VILLDLLPVVVLDFIADLVTRARAALRSRKARS